MHGSNFPNFRCLIFYNIASWFALMPWKTGLFVKHTIHHVCPGATDYEVAVQCFNTRLLIQVSGNEKLFFASGLSGHKIGRWLLDFIKGFFCITTLVSRTLFNISLIQQDNHTFIYRNNSSRHVTSRHVTSRHTHTHTHQWWLKIPASVGEGDVFTFNFQNNAQGQAQN